MSLHLVSLDLPSDNVGMNEQPLTFTYDQSSYDVYKPSVCLDGIIRKDLIQHNGYNRVVGEMSKDLWSSLRTNAIFSNVKIIELWSPLEYRSVSYYNYEDLKGGLLGYLCGRFKGEELMEMTNDYKIVSFIVFFFS